MLYNDFKGKKLSRLGFGCMRFTKDEKTGEYDRKKISEMFDTAIAAGVNYFDTAYPYLDGESELLMAEALAKYPRDSYYIADKFPGHSLPGPVDNRELFEVSLKKCGTDYFDFYLLHNLTEWSEKVYEGEEYHVLPDMLRLREEGKIRHLGFSFHGGLEQLERYLNRHGGIFDFVQIQCNYLDWTLQHAKEKYDMLTERGIGVWVMEPVRGGKLASLPEDASAELAKLRPGCSDASFAFRFLQDLPNVKMILSGMNEVSQVEDNCKTFKEHLPLTKAEREKLFEIAEGMKNSVPCTGCGYCRRGCSSELDIPYLMDCYNSMKYAFDITASMRIDGLAEDKRPAACVNCEKCIPACPQGIDIPKVLEELADIYDKGPKWHDVAKPRVDSVIRDLNLKKE